MAADVGATRGHRDWCWYQHTQRARVQPPATVPDHPYQPDGISGSAPRRCRHSSRGACGYPWHQGHIVRRQPGLHLTSLSWAAAERIACSTGIWSGVRLRFAEPNSIASLGWVVTQGMGGGGRGAKNIRRSPYWPQYFLEFPKCFKMLVLQVGFLHHQKKRLARGKPFSFPGQDQAKASVSTLRSQPSAYSASSLR